MAQLIAKGAEADLLLDLDWNGLKALIKLRKKKKYRHPELDREIRKTRTLLEAGILHRVKEAGVPAPLVYQVDPENATIIMEYLVGVKVRDIIKDLTIDEKKSLFNEIGVNAGLMHHSGIIHGDLTTSNMIKGVNGVVFIDFGLGEFSSEVEKRGVDLNLLYRMLTSTHYEYTETLFTAFKEGYIESLGCDAEVALERMREIGKRGRYIERE